MVRPTIRTAGAAAGIALTILAAGLVGACGPAADDPAQGGVSAREAEALNDAAAMLDNNGQDAVVVTNADEGAGNVE